MGRLGSCPSLVTPGVSDVFFFWFPHPVPFAWRGQRIWSCPLKCVWGVRGRGGPGVWGGGVRSRGTRRGCERYSGDPGETLDTYPSRSWCPLSGSQNDATRLEFITTSLSPFCFLVGHARARLELSL